MTSEPHSKRWPIARALFLGDCGPAPRGFTAYRFGQASYILGHLLAVYCLLVGLIHWSQA